MSNPIFFFVICILNVFFVSFISDFIKLSLNKKENTIVDTLCFLGFYFMAVVLSVINLPSVHEFILYWLGIYMLTLLYKATFINRIFVSLISLIIIESVELLTKIVFAGCLDTTIEQIMKDPIIILVVYTIVRLSPYILIEVYKRAVVTNILVKKENQYVSSLQHFVFMLIPLLSIASIMFLASLESELGRKSTMTVAMIIGMILTMNLLYFYIYNIIMDRYKKLAENLILSKQAEYHSNQYLQIENSLNETKAIKHDLKYHLLNILQKNEMDEMKKELKELICEMELTKYTLYTDNHTIDTMINFVKNKAETLGIAMDIHTNVLTEINIDTKLLCTLLGNAFDNAIEASLHTDEKYIQVRMVLENNSMYIAVENPYQGELAVKNNKITTSKSDKGNHGFGLKSIYDSVDKLGGKVKITTENHVFLLEILIFNI